MNRSFLDRGWSLQSPDHKGAWRDRSLGRALAVVALVPCLSSCGQPAVVTKPPDIPSDQQARSRVRANPLQPLVVEWPASERAELESQLKSGLVVVHYDGSTMDVLTQCRAPGGYTFHGTNVHRDSILIEDQSSLAAALPLGAASLSAKLRQVGKLELSLTVVGNWATEPKRIERKDLEGECANATHVVSTLSVGAFELKSGGSSEVGGGASVANIGAGAEQASRRETLSRAGDEHACQSSEGEPTAPPAGCGALVRLGLTEVRSTVVLPPPADASTPPAPVASSEPPSLPPPLVRTTPPPVEPSQPQTRLEPNNDKYLGSGRSETPNQSSSAYVWGLLGGGVLVALIVVGVAVAASSKKEDKHEPTPIGGLGNVTLPTGISW